MNCHYKIIYHSNCVSEGLATRYVDVKESYAYTLNALILDRTYTLAIQPYYKFKKKSSIIISGTKVEFIFSTPVCIEFNNFNLNSCRKYRHLTSLYIIGRQLHYNMLYRIIFFVTMYFNNYLKILVCLIFNYIVTLVTNRYESILKYLINFYFAVFEIW